MINYIGRRIYYDVADGSVILDTGEKTGSVRQTTVEEDITVYKALSERIRESFDVVELNYGEYEEDFKQQFAIKIDLKTKTPVFTYVELDSNGNENQITPTVPLSVQVEELKAKTNSQEKAIAELTEVVTLSMMM